MSGLSYAKLLDKQWNYYHPIGMAHHIWTGQISKRVAEKNSICCSYGRWKKIVPQRRE